MSTASGIRIDSLLNSLKELQNEKQCLEQRLSEKVSHAQELERIVDKCETKAVQAKEMHQRLIEMHKIGLQKVEQTQHQVDSCHERNREQSAKIQELNALIDKEKDVGLQQVDNFKKEISELSEQLIKARNFYNEKSLQANIEETEKEIERCEEEAKSDTIDGNNLIDNLSSLELASKEPVFLPLVSSATKKFIWSLLEAEEADVDTSLLGLHTQHQEICSIFQ